MNEGSTYYILHKSYISKCLFQTNDLGDWHKRTTWECNCIAETRKLVVIRKKGIQFKQFLSSLVKNEKQLDKLEQLHSKLCK